MRLYLLTFACVVIFATNAMADIIYQSGTLGTTGIPRSSISDDIPATNINSAVFVGVRFQIIEPAKVEQIGGHFLKNTNAIDSFFGAIIKLDNENDFPNSENLSSPDVVGSTLLTFPEPSAEVFGTINVHLDPGWYAVVFGSGLFGASGIGSALRNNVDIGDPSYIGFEPNLRWFNLDIFDDFFDNHRFVVLGKIVPEPSAGCLLVFACLSVVAFRVRKR